MNPKHVIYLSVGLLIICALLSFVLNDCIGNDAAGYYVPMVELFAEGKYDLAFNPMIPPLVPLLGGIVASVLPVSGFMALKMVSTFFMLLGVIPMYQLAKRLVPDDQAVWACALYAICSQVIRFGITAQLTSAKLFLVLWLIERCISVFERATPARIITMSLAMALLGLCRTEGIFYLFFVMITLVWVSFKMKDSWTQRIKKTFVAWCILVGTLLFIWSPWLAYEYQATGYVVLDSRQTGVVKALQSLVRAKTESQTVVLESSVPILNNTPRDIDAQTITTKLYETVDGFYIPYLPLVAIGLVGLWKQKRWGYLEAWLLGAACFNVLVIWAASTQGAPVLKRYIFPSALLVMPYAVLGWTLVRAWLVGKRTATLRFWTILALCIVVTVSVADGLKHVVDSLRGKYAVEKINGLWLQAQGAELDSHGASEAMRENLRFSQYTGRSLVVAAAFPQTACWAQAQHVNIRRHVEKTFQELLNFCEMCGVDVLVVDRHVRQSTRGVDPNSPALVRLPHQAMKSDVELFQLRFD